MGIVGSGVTWQFYQHETSIPLQDIAKPHTAARFLINLFLARFWHGTTFLYWLSFHLEEKKENIVMTGSLQ